MVYYQFQLDIFSRKTFTSDLSLRNRSWLVRTQPVIFKTSAPFAKLSCGFFRLKKLWAPTQNGFLLKVFIGATCTRYMLLVVCGRSYSPAPTGRFSASIARTWVHDHSRLSKRRAGSLLFQYFVTVNCSTMLAIWIHISKSLFFLHWLWVCFATAAEF